MDHDPVALTIPQRVHACAALLRAGGQGDVADVLVELVAQVQANEDTIVAQLIEITTLHVALQERDAAIAQLRAMVGLRGVS